MTIYLRALTHLFLIVALFATSVNTAIGAKDSPRQPNSKNIELLKNLGIYLGEYSTSKGNHEDCQEGELSLIDIEDSSTLMLGSHPLILELGSKEVAKSKDRECEFSTETRIAGKELQMSRSEHCEKKPMRKFEVTVVGSQKGLSYTRTVSEGSEIKKKLNCHLIRLANKDSK